MTPKKLLRQFMVAFAASYAVLCAIIWIVWASLAVGHAGAADARTAPALTVAAVIGAAFIAAPFACVDLM